jgi:hypothetical protein
MRKAARMRDGQVKLKDCDNAQSSALPLEMKKGPGYLTRSEAHLSRLPPKPCHSAAIDWRIDWKSAPVFYLGDASAHRLDGFKLRGCPTTSKPLLYPLRRHSDRRIKSSLDRTRIESHRQETLNSFNLPDNFNKRFSCAHRRATHWPERPSMLGDHFRSRPRKLQPGD